MRQLVLESHAGACWGCLLENPPHPPIPPGRALGSDIHQHHWTPLGAVGAVRIALPRVPLRILLTHF